MNLDANAGYYLGAAISISILYTLPALLIVVSKVRKRAKSKKIIENTSILVYGIIFSIVMLLGLAYLSFLGALFTFFMYLICFYVDYLFYEKAKN